MMSKFEKNTRRHRGWPTVRTIDDVY